MNPRTYPKTFYFFFYAASASLIPFLVIYYESLGLNGRQIGLLTAIPPLVSMGAAPIWGSLADISHQHTRLLLTAIFGAASLALVISLASQYIWLIGVVLAFAFFLAPIVPLADNATMNILGEDGDQYGRLRLWGAVGWGLAGPVAGWLMDSWGLIWAFYCYSILLGGCWLVARRLPVDDAKLGLPFGEGLRTLLKNRSWVLFLMLLFVGGVGLSMVHNYLFLYLQVLGAGTITMGLALTIATISEISIFFVSERLLKRYGPQNMLILAVVALIVRLAAYSVITQPWLVLVVQLLHGIAFAALLVSAVSYANKLAPPGLGATAQGIVYSVAFGIGGATGGLLGGHLFDLVGPFIMYRLAALALILGLGLFIILNRRLQAQQATPDQPLEAPTPASTNPPEQ